MKVTALFEETNVFLETLKKVLSVQEDEFLRQSLVTQGIPSPKTLIKEHKKINGRGEFPTRLVIPVINFTATFSKIGYLRIKTVLDKAKLNYSSVSILQSYNPQESLEELRINRDGGTIASVHATKIYLSIKIATTRKKVRFLSPRKSGQTERTPRPPERKIGFKS